MMPSQFAPMKIDEISFGRAERRVTINGKQRLRGDLLTHADLASIAVANRNALIENRFIAVFPKGVEVRGLGAAAPVAAAIEGDFHIVATGEPGQYRVIRGLVVMESGTKDAAAEFVAAEQAKALADAPAPTSAPQGGQTAAASGKRRKRNKRSRRARKPAAPAPGADQENGPIE